MLHHVISVRLLASYHSRNRIKLAYWLAHLIVTLAIRVQSQQVHLLQVDYHVWTNK